MSKDDIMNCNDESGLDVGDCSLRQFERNNYFYGKLLTVSDFQLEQNYFNEKRHLINRNVLGTGVVCGLVVQNVTKVGEKCDCGDGKTHVNEKWQVTITAGTAIDCRGREIIVPNKGPYDVNDFDPQLFAGPFGLYLKRKDELIGPVPTPANTSSCDEMCCYGKIAEKFEFVFDSLPDSILSTIKLSPTKKAPSDVEHTIIDASMPTTLEISKITDFELLKRKLAYDSMLQTCDCCNDPKVLLAVLKQSRDNLSVLEIQPNETMLYKEIVYNNPMLYNLIGKVFEKKDQSTVTNTTGIYEVPAGKLKGGFNISDPIPHQISGIGTPSIVLGKIFDPVVDKKKVIKKEVVSYMEDMIVWQLLQELQNKTAPEITTALETHFTDASISNTSYFLKERSLLFFKAIDITNTNFRIVIYDPNKTDGRQVTLRWWATGAKQV